MIYYAYFHSIMKCDIVLGGGMSREITRVFHLQKKIMRIVTGVNSRSRPVLKALKYCW